MKRMLDLFSGLHGASSAFTEPPRWEVVSIDSNPELDADHHLDIGLSQLEILKLGRFNLIWASPPCVEFFKCRAAFFPDHFGTQPDMRLVQSTIDLIALMDPDVWVIENTRSGAHYIEPLLGPPRQIHGPFYLWGNFPRFSAEIPANHKDDEVRSIWSSDPLRSNIRSKVPYGISHALRDAIENQETLREHFGFE